MKIRIDGIGNWTIKKDAHVVDFKNVEEVFVKTKNFVIIILSFISNSRRSQLMKDKF